MLPEQIQPQDSTVTKDLVVFRRGSRSYAALALAKTHHKGRCGVTVFEITNLPSGMVSTSISGESLDLDERWCNVTALAVETDNDGEATYLYVAAQETADLRVLEIVSNADPMDPRPLELREVGCYQQVEPRGPDPNGNGVGKNDPDGLYDDIFVSSIAVQGGLVYVGYWSAGVHIRPVTAMRPSDGSCLW